jgi:PilZ domain-containing protein
MAITNPRDIVGRAELVLPEPPAKLELLAAAGGSMKIELLSRNGLEYRARAPKLRLQPRSTLRARVDAIDGGGHDVEMLVAGIEPESKWTVIARLQVTAIHERSAQRTTARVRVGERAPLYAMACRAIRAGEQFDVEVADLSTTGVAFVSDRAFHPGDLVALMPSVDGQPVRLRVRVLRADPLDDALARVGCEIDAVTDANRERIGRLAQSAQ